MAILTKMKKKSKSNTISKSKSRKHFNKSRKLAKLGKMKGGMNSNTTPLIPNPLQNMSKSPYNTVIKTQQLPPRSSLGLEQLTSGKANKNRYDPRRGTKQAIFDRM